MNDINHCKRVVRCMKSLESASRTKIEIKNNKGLLLGYLKPVDTLLASDSDIITKLTRWRKMFMKYFLTQFHATEERTKLWIQRVVIKDDTRLLFLILDEIEKPIGNFGVCNISSESAELDNLIRGERGGDPKLVYFSELFLMNWIYRNLNVDRIFLHVFSTNTRTISLHSSIGFNISRGYSLIKHVSNKEVRYEVGKEKDKATDELTYLEMDFFRNDFYTKYDFLRGQVV